jgi:hypothetical protein
MPSTATKPSGEFISIVREFFTKTNESIKELSDKVDSLKDTNRDRADALRVEFEAKLAALRVEFEAKLRQVQEISNDIIGLKRDVGFWGKILSVIGITALGAAVTALMRSILR